MRIRIALLASIRAELDYHLSNFTATSLRLTNRAFIHLQRSIIADPDIGERWRAAFANGETACERLGGVHLLLHGIWAFKDSGERERTDLVMGHHISDDQEVSAAAEALILTECKINRVVADLDIAIERARIQASTYSDGVLGGIELRQYKFIVIVTSDCLTMPIDCHQGDSIYRHINLAVNPGTPSKVAVKLAGKQRTAPRPID